MWLRMAPIVISACALVVAFSSAAVTAYFQYFRRPRLSIVVNGEMDVWRTPEMHLAFLVPTVIVNDGARYGIVQRIVGEITMPDGYVAPFRWRMFAEAKAVGDESRELKVWGGFAGWAETLVVPSRSAITRRIQFVSERAVIVTPGRYRIEFELHSAHSADVVAHASVWYELTENSEAALIACVANPKTRTVERSVRLPLTRG